MVLFINLFGITFNQPGTYILGEDIDTSAFGGITISSSDVTLDLGGRTLSTGSSIDIITVDASLRNVTIMNGFIAKDIFNFGISVGSDCENITIKDISIKAFSNTGNGGLIGIFINSGCVTVNINNILIDQESADRGIVVSSGCRDVSIDNCFINVASSALQLNGAAGGSNDIARAIIDNIVIVESNPTTTAANAVVQMQYCVNSTVSNLSIADCGPGNTSTTLSMMRLDNNTANTFQNITIMNNTGPTTSSLYGIELITTSSCIFENIMVLDDTGATNGAATIEGVRLSTNSSFNSFNNVQIITQTATLGTNYGIMIGSGCNGNVFTDVVINGLVTTDGALTGFSINGGSANVLDGFKIVRCRSTSGTPTVRGVELNNTSGNSLSNGEINQIIVSGATLTGIDMTIALVNNFSAISILNLQGTTNEVSGISTVDNCSSNIIEGCTINRLTATTAAVNGIRFVPTNSGSVSNSVIGAVISRCSSAGAVSGIRINTNMTNSLIDSCIIQYNSSSGTTCIGIDLGSASSPGGWSILDNKIMFNNGNNAGNSLGIRQAAAAATTNFYVRNFSSANGTTGGNQLSGLAAGSVATATFSTLNTATGPATNFAVTPT